MESESFISIFKNSRFILSFIGSMIFGLAIAPVFAMGQFSVYITSYFHYYNPLIDMQYGNLIHPIIFFFITFSAPLGGILEKKIGMYFPLIISICLIEIFLFIFINQTNLFITFFLLIFLGLSIGFVIPILQKNLMCFFPNETGIISSICTSSYILISAFVSILGEKLINPNKVILTKNEIVYSFDLSKNYIKYYKYVLFFNPFILLISLFLIKKYDQPLINKIDNNIISLNKHDPHYLINLKAVIFHKRTIGIAIFSILCIFVINYSHSTFRVYGALNSFNGNVMQYASAFLGIGVIVISPIWGIINDKFEFSKIITIISFGTLFQAIIITIFIHSSTAYIICIFISPIFSTGIGTIISPHIFKEYSEKFFF